ncbi:cyclic lactone autoinducer peptide [Paenibacillus graminis]|nr:cyclic lactone autoinducer peptide [Paenibacillus graminis]MEC0168140.1 cyclic lactone autoinducer peptide [Paenibacillus graminis]
MKKIGTKTAHSALMAVASLLSLLAVAVVSTASVIYVHQGETPEELLK